MGHADGVSDDGGGVQPMVVGGKDTEGLLVELGEASCVVESEMLCCVADVIPAVLMNMGAQLKEAKALVILDGRKAIQFLKAFLNGAQRRLEVM